MKRSSLSPITVILVIASAVLSELSAAQSVSFPLAHPAVGALLGIRGPVSQIQYLDGQDRITIAISTDGLSATSTTSSDKIFKGQYRYDSTRRQLNYAETLVEGQATSIWTYSATGCAIRYENTPAKKSGLPAEVEVAKCDAQNRIIRREVRAEKIAAPFITTVAWAADGRSNRVVYRDASGAVTRSTERFDAKGRLLSVERVDEHETQITIIVTYVDDARGNWTQQKTVTTARFPCKPHPYSMGCQPDSKPVIELDERRITYR